MDWRGWRCSITSELGQRLLGAGVVDEGLAGGGGMRAATAALLSARGKPLATWCSRATHRRRGADRVVRTGRGGGAWALSHTQIAVRDPSVILEIEELRW